jgi:oligopeptide/dipeptide ABC transporter ATP-binding protein
MNVEGVSKHLRVGSFRGASQLRAVDGVDFQMTAGETLGLVGESGSGKSTLANVMAGLEPATSGRVMFGGADLTRVRGRRLRALRRDIQMVFQDPYGSFAPMTSVGMSLDVSTKAQVINLLDDLQSRLGLTYLFISHDLSTLRYLSDRIAVMYLGRIVEMGPASEIYQRPRHPYTQALLSAVPVPNPVTQRARQRILLAGDIPSPLSLPAGCRFHTRCPYVMDICRTDDPPTVDLGGVTVACHLHGTAQPNGASSRHD